MDIVKIYCSAHHEHDVPAHIFGQWAATRALGSGCDLAPHWTVTLVQCGRCIRAHVDRMTERQATIVAKRISESVPVVVDWTTIAPVGGFAKSVIAAVRDAMDTQEYYDASAPADWSAELRAKVASSTAADIERERNRVTIDQEDF